jgi:hypothetical protein
MILRGRPSSRNRHAKIIPLRQASRYRAPSRNAYPPELNVYDETAVTQRTEGATIRFDATLSTIDTSAVLRLPETASKNLPSRGQVAVHGTINGAEFQTVLEPDGNFGH